MVAIKYFVKKRKVNKLKKEFIIIILVIIIIIILEVITNNYSNKSIKSISGELNDLREQLLNNAEESKEEIDNKAKDTYYKWKEYFKVLAYYIEHDELEKVNTELTLLKTYTEIEEYNSAIPVIDKCNFILEHIQDKQEFSFQSIF